MISALEHRRPFGLLIAAETPVTDADAQAGPLRWLRCRAVHDHDAGRAWLLARLGSDGTAS